MNAPCRPNVTGSRRISDALKRWPAPQGVIPVPELPLLIQWASAFRLSPHRPSAPVERAA